jgi:hypothetical protein
MRKEDWAAFKFILRLSIRFTPRVVVAPYVGAFRGMQVVLDRFHAEITAFCDAERKAQQDVNSSERVIG